MRWSAVPLSTLLFLGLLLPSVAHAAAESVRRQESVVVEQNTITVDTLLEYKAYVPGEPLNVVLRYSAICNVTFQKLTPARPTAFAPRRAVTGQISGVTGSPPAGVVGNIGSVSVDVIFEKLATAANGMLTGTVSLDLFLSVDNDCDAATGNADGMESVAAIRIQISVSSDFARSPEQKQPRR